MTIWTVANGETFDGLLQTGGVTFSATNFQTGYGRASYLLAGGSAQELSDDFGSEQSRVWHKHYLVQNIGNTFRDGYCRFFDAAGNERIRCDLVLDATYGIRVRVSAVNGGTVTELFTTDPLKPFYTNTAFANTTATPQGDFTLDINYVGAGWVRAYRNGELVGSFTGDPRLGFTGGIRFNKVRSARATSTWGESCFSQIINADEDIRFIKPVTCYPNAAGTTNTATGAYTDVDEIGESGVDYVQGTAAGQKFTFNLTNLNAVLGTVQVRSVWFRARVQGPDGVSPTTFKINVRTNGAEYQGAAVVPGSAGWTLVTQKYDSNPNTGLAWTNALIDAMEAGGLFEA